MSLISRDPEHCSVRLAAQLAVADVPDVRDNLERVEVAEHGVNPLALLDIERENVALAAAEYVEGVGVSGGEVLAQRHHGARERPERIRRDELLDLRAVLAVRGHGDHLRGPIYRRFVVI